MKSIMVSFCAVFFPRDVLDEILNLIESVSEGFPTYTCAVKARTYAVRDGIFKPLFTSSRRE